MASSYTTNSGIEKPTTGEQSGTWGDTVNTNMDILDVLVSGFVSITATGTAETLTTTDGAVTNGMNRLIKYVDGGDLGGNCTVTLSPNDQEKFIFVENGLSASRSLIFTQGSGGNFTLQNGKQAVIRSDGAGAGAEVLGALTNLEITTLEVTGAAALDGAATLGSTLAVTSTSTMSAKVTHNYTSSARMPVGTTGQRDGSPAVGDFRYNSTTNEFEGYAGSSPAWGSIGGGAGYFKGDNGTVGSSAGDIFRINELALDADVTITSTENASATGPLTVSSSFTLTVEGTLVII